MVGERLMRDPMHTTTGVARHGRLQSRCTDTALSRRRRPRSAVVATGGGIQDKIPSRAHRLGIAALINRNMESGSEHGASIRRVRTAWLGPTGQGLRFSQLFTPNRVMCAGAGASRLVAALPLGTFSVTRFVTECAGLPDTKPVAASGALCVVRRPEKD